MGAPTTRITFDIQYYKVPRGTQKIIRRMLKELKNTITQELPIQLTDACVPTIDRGTIVISGICAHSRITDDQLEALVKWFDKKCAEYGEGTLDGLHRYIHLSNDHTAYATNVYGYSTYCNKPGDMRLVTGASYQATYQSFRVTVEPPASSGGHR